MTESPLERATQLRRLWALRHAVLALGWLLMAAALVLPVQGDRAGGPCLFWTAFTLPVIIIYGFTAPYLLLAAPTVLGAIVALLVPVVLYFALHRCKTLAVILVIGALSAGALAFWVVPSYGYYLGVAGMAVEAGGCILSSLVLTVKPDWTYCQKCGYDLRGSGPTGATHCPECGQKFPPQTLRAFHRVA
jgi:hypothetical protein